MMDAYTLYDSYVEDLTQTEHKCAYGDVVLDRLNGQFCICLNCGFEIKNELPVEQYGSDMFAAYNKPNESSANFRVVGVSNRVRGLNKALLCLTSEYNKSKGGKITKKLLEWNYRAPEGESIPDNVCIDAAETYNSLQDSEHIVKRANGLNGFLAALLYESCIKHNVPRKPKLIADMAGIHSKQLSKGDQLLYQLAQDKAIVLSNTDTMTNDYVVQYFERLQLDDYLEYINFVNELIVATDVDKIRTEENSCRLSTRCAGAIFILCEQLKIKFVTRDAIAKQCSISKSTFTRFIKLVKTHKSNPGVVAIFEKYNIPQY